MQKPQFWYLQYLCRNKIAALTAILLLSAPSLKAQFRETLNLPDHDDKPYYFGIVLGYNTSHYNVSLNPQYLEQDTIMTVNSQNSGRIHLGIMANLQLNNRWDIRFYPLNLIFSEKRFIYTLKYPDPGETALIQDKKVESIVMSFPLQVRLKSDRINNFRVYTLGGIKYDYDLASDANASNTGTESSRNMEAMRCAMRGGQCENGGGPRLPSRRNRASRQSRALEMEPGRAIAREQEYHATLAEAGDRAANR